jgi:peptide/nickel transport system substrate-binding protein
VLFMDPAAAYSAADYQFQRMTLRGLFDYQAGGTLEERATPLPDLALEVPTQENGGISADGLTYTIELRDGVMWNVDEPRPVVAEDVVRGVKRMRNPVVGSAARDYYLNTIAGLREFCDGFADVAPEVEPIREYI